MIVTQIAIYCISKSHYYFSLVSRTYDSRARYNHVSTSLKNIDDIKKIDDLILHCLKNSEK